MEKTLNESPVPVNDTPIKDRRFIVWDTKDGEPLFDGAGECTSSGCMGRVEIDNVYLATYPRYPVGSPKLADLGVNDRICGVKFWRGVYDVIRVA